MDSADANQENGPTSKRTPEERKLTYRQLLNKIEHIQATEDLGLNTAQQIGDILKEVNDLEEECTITTRIEHADETLLDCIILSSASTILVKCIESIDVFTCTYKPSEFSSKLKLLFGNEKLEAEEINPFGLLGLLNNARSVIPAIFPNNYVYGTYDLNKLPAPKPKIKRKTDTKEKLQKKEPEKVKEIDKEESSIDEIVKVLYNILTEECNRNKGEAIPYYDYVIDTDNFTNTVENIFYCSFLVRDGKAHFDLDNNGVPYIKPMKKSELKAMRDRGEGNSQVITNITMEEWEMFTKPGLIQRFKSKSVSTRV